MKLKGTQMFRLSALTRWGLGVIALVSIASMSCTKDEESTDLEAQDPVEEEADAAAEPALPPSAPQPESSVPAPTEEVAAPATHGAPVPVMSGSPGRRVMYVKTNGTAIRERAEAGSKVIGKLDKGDHLLVDIDGDWARTERGGYVALKALSETGIGRGKKPVKWRQGNGEPVAKPKAAKKSAVKKTDKAPKAAPQAIVPPVKEEPLESAE